MLVLVLSSFAGRAQAQCVEGRIESEATAGRCCWPGQTWDAEHARCSGPPTCPAERVAEGDACVLATPPAPIASVAETSPTRAAPEAPAHRMYDEHVIGGAITLGASWFITAVMGTVDENPIAWIPLAGSFLWAYFRGDLVPMILGIAGTVTQALGLVLLIIGVVGHDVDASEALLVPGAPGADVGASLVVRF